MMMILLSILFLSMFILFMKHPISLSITLLVKAILIALSVGMMISNFWISYIMFLIMIGGLLIIFLYMTNVASNEKFKFYKLIVLYSIFFILSILFMMKPYSLYFTIKINMISNYLNNMNFNMLIMKFFNYPFSSLMIIMFILLLLTMIMSVKMTNLMKGPLRQKY